MEFPPRAAENDRRRWAKGRNAHQPKWRQGAPAGDALKARCLVGNGVARPRSGMVVDPFGLWRGWPFKEGSCSGAF